MKISRAQPSPQNVSSFLNPHKCVDNAMLALTNVTMVQFVPKSNANNAEYWRNVSGDIITNLLLDKGPIV